MKSVSRIQSYLQYLPVYLLFLLIPFSEQPVFAGQEKTIDGVLHIQNSSQPASGVRTLYLTEQWRAGGDEGDMFFGQITRVRADAESNIFVLDAQLQQVHVFSPDGELMNTLFGEGEGPGEITRALDLVLWPDGRVGAVTRFPGRIVNVEADGAPATATCDGNSPMISFEAVQHGGGNTVVACANRLESQREGVSAREFYLASISDQCNELHRYVETSLEVDYQNNFVFDEIKALNNYLNSYAVGPDGRVYVAADHSDYRISVFTPDGNLERIIEREFTSRRRTDFERSRIEAMIERRFRTFPFDLTTNIEDSEPVVAWQHRGLSVARDGTLWVRHSRSGDDLPSGVILRFDVFDSQGHYLEQIDVACAGEANFDGVFVFEDQVVVVRGFPDSMRSVLGGGRGPLLAEDAEARTPEVICYRVAK